MAARIHKGTKDNPWPEQVREKIRASMLVNRLLGHALGTVKMETTQVTAARALLDKILPSLQSVEAKVEDTTQKWIGPPPMTIDEWEQSRITNGSVTEH